MDECVVHQIDGKIACAVDDLAVDRGRLEHDVDSMLPEDSKLFQ